jgi:hypothetical protein
MPRDVQGRIWEFRNTPRKCLWISKGWSVWETFSYLVHNPPLCVWNIILRLVGSRLFCYRTQRIYRIRGSRRVAPGGFCYRTQRIFGIRGSSRVDPGGFCYRTQRICRIVVVQTVLLRNLVKAIGAPGPRLGVSFSIGRCRDIGHTKEGSS